MFVLASALFFVGLFVSIGVIYIGIASNMPRIEQVIAQRNGADLKERVIRVGVAHTTTRPAAVVLAFTPRTKLPAIARTTSALKIAA
jgi:hypothetical protein